MSDTIQKSSRTTISDIISGTVEFDDISPLLTKPLLEDCTIENLELLKEDLLQASYGAEFLLDVGWYSTSESSGAFKILVIQNYDWERPIFQALSTSITDMVYQIKMAEAHILQKTPNHEPK